MSAKKSVLILSLIFLVSGICGKAFARPIYVDANAPAGGDGSGWNKAYKYLQDALSKAADGNEIWVADGVYKPDQNSVKPNGTGERTASFQLISGVEIYGGYAGFGEPNQDARDIKNFKTILSGDISVIDSNSDNSFHVVTASGTNANAILDGFTITAGNANGPDWPDYSGGGMYNDSNATITNCTFSGNSAYWHGGGIYNASGNPTISNCKFTANLATGYSDSLREGGGMYNSSGSPTITDCNFSGNSADYNGGGIYNNSGSPKITNCIFSRNSANSWGSSGGGMYNSSGSPKITNCVFNENWSNVAGGGMSNDSGNPTITNCTFIGNSAKGYYDYYGYYHEGSGGGYAGGWPPATVTNCILWGNRVGTLWYFYSYSYEQISGYASVTYSDVEDGWPGEGNIDETPCLAADGYHLTECSPCIDRGDPCYVAGPGATDIDVEPRKMDGDHDRMVTVDMGADEFNGPDKEPNHIVVDDFADYNDFPPNIKIISDTWKTTGGAKVGYFEPNRAELTFVHESKQSMPFDYNNTNPPYYSEASRTFDPCQDWTRLGVNELSLWLKGYQKYVGSFTRSGSNPNYAYTMTAAGAGISEPNWRKPSRFRDEFHYAYMQVEEGDCNIVVKVEDISCEDICCTNSRARAGVMIRDSLADDSAYAMVCITPDPCNGVMFQYRYETGGVSYEFTQSGPTAPCWLRLERHWDVWSGLFYVYNASYATNLLPSGEPNWTQLGDPDFFYSMNWWPVYIGLSLTARDACATCKAVFSNVSIATGWYPDLVPLPLPLPLTDKDIGIKSNTAAPLYVTLQDSSNIAATVPHSDNPNAVLRCTWGEPWNIALSDFAPVNPTKIKKITIRVGDITNPQSDGTGTLYFDDIRLYIPPCTPPPAPNDINYPDTSNCDGSYTVCWTTSIGATYHQLERSKDGGGYENVYTGDVNCYTDNVSCSGSYRYRVRECNDCGCSDPCTGKWDCVVTVKPPVPTSITYPTIDCDGSYTVTWAESCGATYYELERSKDGDIYNNVYTGPLTSYNESGLGSGSYRYRVRACNVCGCSSGWCTGDHNCVVTTLPPEIPISITYPGIDCDGSYIVSWEASTGATSYELERSKDGGAYVNVYTGPLTSYNESGLGSGSYRYRVRACNVCYCSEWRIGTWDCVVTFIPSVPATITYPDCNCGGSYTVSWATSSRATSYELERSKDGDAYGNVYTGPLTSYNESGLGDGSYRYRARACNACGCSNWCTGDHNCVVAIFPPEVPVSLTYPTCDDDGSYPVCWAPSTGAKSYELERSSDGGITWPVQKSIPAPSTCYNEEDVGVGIYRYRVKATNAGCCSSDWGTIDMNCVVTPPLEAPATITVPASDADGVYDVSWAASSGATSYQLESSAPASGTTIYPFWVNVYDGTATTYKENVGGGTWYYRVKATNAGGCSTDWTTGTNSCVVADCLKSTDPNYAGWKTWRYPGCWCYQYQCRGDINGKKNLGLRVQALDLAILAAGFNKNDAALAAVPNGICADTTHKKNLGLRVQALDLAELAKYFNKADAQVPSCTAGYYNYWKTP